MPTPTFEDERHAWKLYLKAIEEIVVTAKGTEVQPIAIFRQANWDQIGKGNFDLFLQQEEVNSIPVWGGFGVPSGKTLDREYDLFLSAVTQRVPDSVVQEVTKEDAAMVKTYKDSIDVAVIERNRLSSQTDTEWSEYFAANANDPNRYTLAYWRINVSAYYPQYEIARKSINMYNAGILKVMAKYVKLEAQELYGARLLFDSSEQMVKLPEQGGWESKPENWSQYKKQWIEDGDVSLAAFRTKPDMNPPAEYYIDHRKNESTHIDSSWGGSFGASSGWWSFGGGAGGSHIEEEAKSSVTAIKIGFKRIEDFPVFRGPWFNMAIIDKYGDKAPEYFGPLGTMNVLPLTFIVARGVSLTVECSDTLSTLVEDHFHASGGFGIGPFNFSANRETNSIYSSYQRDATGFKMTDLSDICYIIAIRCSIPHSVQDLELMGNALRYAEKGEPSPVKLSEEVKKQSET